MAAAQGSVISLVAVEVLRLFCHIFAHEFLFNPHFDLERDYIIREFDTEFNGIPCVRKYCQLFTHESNAFLSVITPIETNACPDAEKCQKNARNHARNRPFPLRHVDFHLTHECLSPPHSPPQTVSGSNHPCRHCSHLLTDRWR